MRKLRRPSGRMAATQIAAIASLYIFVHVPSAAAQPASAPGAVAASAPQSTAPRAEPNSPVSIVELRGNAEELGEAYAAQLGETVRLLLRDYLARFFEDTRVREHIDRPRALQVAAEFEPYLSRSHRDEIRTLATKAGLDHRELMLAQCLPDIALATACSTIALPASGSSDGAARFGRNLDFSALGILDRQSVLFVYHPQDRYAFASVGWPGIVGVLSGMNEHGLTLANMEVPRPPRRPQAMPYMLLYRTVLEQCRTVDEALALLKKTPRQSANNLMLMDAAGTRAVAEITPDGVIVRRAPDTAALVSTNHQRGDDDNSRGRCPRYDSLQDAAREHFGRIGEPDLEAMLAGAAQGERTIQSMVFEPANRVVYLAVGASAPTQRFIRVDLTPYLR